MDRFGSNNHDPIHQTSGSNFEQNRQYTAIGPERNIGPAFNVPEPTALPSWGGNAAWGAPPPATVRTFDQEG